MYTQHPDFELHHVTSLANGMLAGMTWTEAWNKLAQSGPWQEQNPLFCWSQKNKKVMEHIWTSWSQPKSAKSQLSHRCMSKEEILNWTSLSFRVALHMLHSIVVKIADRYIICYKTWHYFMNHKEGKTHAKSIKTWPYVVFPVQRC